MSEDNPVRVIDAFVDSLNLSKLDFTQAELSVMGRPAYEPRDLLKMYIYSYFYKILSSRKLMKECQRNIELFYLLPAASLQSPEKLDVHADFMDPDKCIKFHEITPRCTISCTRYLLTFL